MCGQMIEVGEPDRARIATLGGVVKVRLPDATEKLYGMTAGHVITEEPFYEGSNPGSNEEEDNDEDEESLLDEDELEIELAFEGDQDRGEIGKEISGPREMQSVRLQWPLIGRISVASNPNAGPDLDWALVDFKNITAQ